MKQFKKFPCIQHTIVTNLRLLLYFDSSHCSCYWVKLKDTYNACSNFICLRLKLKLKTKSHCLCACHTKKKDTIVLICKENDTKGISSCIYSNKNHSGSHTKFHVLQSVFLKEKKEIRHWNWKEESCISVVESEAFTSSIGNQAEYDSKISSTRNSSASVE